MLIHPSFDQVIVLTGASNGIGAATAQLFLEQGAKVAALDIVDASASPDGERLNVKCDVSSEESVNAAIKQVLDKWSTIDVLVNVAGVMDQFGEKNSFPLLLTEGFS